MNLLLMSIQNLKVNIFKIKENHHYFHSHFVDDTKYPNWSALEENLLVKKQKLESKLEENQEVINSFVKTHLN